MHALETFQIERLLVEEGEYFLLFSNNITFNFFNQLKTARCTKRMTKLTQQIPLNKVHK